MSTDTENQAKDSEQENSEDVPMPITAHLSELRTRLVHSIIAILGIFVVATVCEMELNQPILSIFRKPLEARGIPLHFMELTEPFFTYLRIGLYTSLFLTFPYVMGQIWLFVRPALYSRERSAVWPFIILSYPLFVGGGLFGYFMVLPIGYDFFLSFENEVTIPVEHGVLSIPDHSPSFCFWTRLRTTDHLFYLDSNWFNQRGLVAQKPKVLTGGDLHRRCNFNSPGCFHPDSDGRSVGHSLRNQCFCIPNGPSQRSFFFLPP